MCAPKAPSPPDPKDTSAAQTGTNVSTAIANAFLENTNTNTPDGSSTFDQSGSYTWTDPYTNKSYTVPRFTETSTLSPQNQAIYDQNQAAKLNLAETGNQQSAFLKDYLSQPVDLSSGNVEKYINSHFADDFNKQQGQLQDTLLGKLANQGIGAGSDAYTKALADFNKSRNDAYDNLYGNQYQNAVQDIIAQRNQPINEITALLSGSQVQSPQLQGANIQGIPTTDNAGLINTNYQQKLAAWQQQVAQQNGILGGLFGLGAAGIMAA